jgi:signal transduction histidine kinase
VKAVSRPARGPEAVEAGADPVSYRAMRLLGLAAIAVVLIGAFNSAPAPGLHGDRLSVSIAVTVFTLGTITLVRLTHASDALLVSLLSVVVLAAAVLVGLQPNGPGFLGVFPAVSVAALRLALPAAAGVAGLGVGALAAAWSVGRSSHPAIGIVLNAFGVLAFFVLALFVRRHREANDRARQLIAELNETRAAQARAAALAERQRLAREMHDVLAHSLSGLVLNLESARLLADRNGTDRQLGMAIARAQRLAKNGLEEARRAIGMLRDDALPGPDRLAGLAAEFELDTGIACTFTVEGPERDLGSDGRLTLYRVAQEALTNIRKHADPDRVDLRLSYEATRTSLTVVDHRSGGHRPPRGDGTGYGLTGMRERAELLGGTLTAEPIDDGFRVTLRIPA